MVHSREVDRLLSVTDSFGIPGKQIHVITLGCEQDGSWMVLSKENLHQSERLRTALEAIPARWHDTAGAVSIIGTGITASHEKIREGSKALQELCVKSFGIATSSFRITWLVERLKIGVVVQHFHRIFIENSSPRVP